MVVEKQYASIVLSSTTELTCDKYQIILTHLTHAYKQCQTLLASSARCSSKLYLALDYFELK